MKSSGPDATQGLDYGYGTQSPSNGVSFGGSRLSPPPHRRYQSAELPPRGGNNGRSRSPIRPRRQGLQSMSRSVTGSKMKLAVRSVRRGTDDWHNLIRPFVSDLAFRSIVSRRSQSEVSFRPYNSHAAVLFVDLSGYSRITAAIAHRGAHALSSVVNAYLSRLLKIIHRNGGDVVKFAGDAVLVVWEGPQKKLGLNVVAAAKCSIQLQKEAGSHPVEGTPYSFRTHCGLCCGQLESEIFTATTHATMQRRYHSVGGEAVNEVGGLVDLAKAGEVCVSAGVVDYLGDMAEYSDVPGDSHNSKILIAFEPEPSLLDRTEDHIEDTMADRLDRRDKEVEDDFIHRSVLRSLSHGGPSSTYIAQMRNLCVLFVAMTSNGSSVNWLMEVQSVLDRKHCPIVQIIDDDKGVHIVCAVNLYESSPEACVLGLDVCRELVDRQVGCAIGMSMGSTFCGVTGERSIACRWDITGPAVVRAARLMQYALSNSLEVAIDQSVYDNPMASTRMAEVHAGINLKGTAQPVPVYGLSETRNFSSQRVLETMHGNVHNQKVEELCQYIRQSSRCAVVVTGPALAGKKIVCQRASGKCDVVPFLHTCDHAAGLLQVARPIATWFRCIDCGDCRERANVILQHMEQKRWSRAHDECIALVSFAIENGLRACMVIDRAQFLDEFSLSLIRECLHTTTRRHRSTRAIEPLDAAKETADTGGKICFLCVHVSLYNWPTAPQLVEDITRSHRLLKIPVVEIREASVEELRTLYRDLADNDINEVTLRMLADYSGHCAGYFIERVSALWSMSNVLSEEGKARYTEITQDLTLRMPAGSLRKNKELTVMQVSAEVAMRYSQLYDELPPLHQMVTKVLTIATRKGNYKLPRIVLWEVMNDLIGEGIEVSALDVVIEEMKEMCLLKTFMKEGEESIRLQSPALIDIAMEVCTPIQVNSIGNTLLERLDLIQSDYFKIPLVMAALYRLVDGSKEKQKRQWSMGYKALLEASQGWPEGKLTHWKEIMEDEIEAAGYEVRDVLGEDLSYPIVAGGKAASHQVMMLKFYQAPVSFGPMGHTLSVICRNTVHEYTVFHGASAEVVTKLRSDMESASGRYLEEMTSLEEYLAELGLEASPEMIQQERDMISYIAKPASSSDEVESKAAKMLEEFIPQFVETRLKRLRSMVGKLRDSDTPAFLLRAEKAIKIAYQVFQKKNVCHFDAAQDAIISLATMNWKPKPVPEYLPIIMLQTVARLRNRTLKRLSTAQLATFGHQHTINDLGAFLVVTALLYAAQESTC